MRLDECAFAQESVDYLGFRVDRHGLHVTDRYKGKIKNVPRPKNKKQLQRFIGMVQYLHKFIPDLQIDLKDFHKLLHKNTPYE